MLQISSSARVLCAVVANDEVIVHVAHKRTLGAFLPSEACPNPAGTKRPDAPIFLLLSVPALRSAAQSAICQMIFSQRKAPFSTGTCALRRQHKISRHSIKQHVSSCSAKTLWLHSYSFSRYSLSLAHCDGADRRQLSVLCSPIVFEVIK